MSRFIHWHEGLFLQPHHLQAFQRSMIHHAWAGARLHQSFPYGVVEAKYSRDELKAGRLKFDSLHVVMKESGTVFKLGENGDVASLDLTHALKTKPEGFTVGLALPEWRAGHKNTIAYGEAVTGHAPNLRFRAVETQIPDEHHVSNENSVTNRPMPVQFLEFNARLMLSTDFRDGMEFLPLIRVLARSREDEMSTHSADADFVPATLLLSGSAVLFKLVRDLAAAVAAVRSQLGDQLASSPFDLRALQGAQFEQLHRLRCLARGASLLGSMVDDATSRTACAGRVPTFEAYLAMQDLLAELSSLYPAKRVFSWKSYDHDDPYPGFADLDAKIRAFLHPAGTRFRKFNFILEKDIFFGDIPPGFFEDITGVYLSIETDQDPTTLARLVAERNHFKLLPASFVENLAVWGMPLQEERNVPAELPLKAAQYYYHVDVSSRQEMWRFFLTEPKAAVHFQGSDLSRYRLALYVTLPEPKAP